MKERNGRIRQRGKGGIKIKRKNKSMYPLRRLTL
jgi:hypothetical protein